jgi:hypothetical protein
LTGEVASATLISQRGFPDLTTEKAHGTRVGDADRPRARLSPAGLNVTKECQMRRTSIHAVVLIVLAALLLVLAGCGGGGKKAGGTTAASAPSTTEAMTTEAASTQAATTATTQAPDLSGLASASNCKQLADLGAQYSQAITGAANSQDLEKTGQLLEELASKAPSEIRSDFKVVADAYTKLVGTIGQLKPGKAPDAATLAKLQKAIAGLNQAKLTKATQHISTWLRKNCGA